MKKLTALLFLCLLTIGLIAQTTSLINYVVKEGDTLYAISKKHGITVEHLLKHNDYLRFDYLGIGDTLIFPLLLTAEVEPKNTIDASKNPDNVPHIVTEGETLYALSKRYEIPLKQIIAYNPKIEQNVIKMSDTLVIPLNIQIPDNKNTNPAIVETIEGKFSHIVDIGETLYGISKRYEVSIDDMLALNPSLNTNIGIGDTVMINNSILTPQTVTQKTTIDETTDVNEAVENYDQTHKVNKGETLYGLSREYDVDIAELVRWNKLDDTSLPEGFELIVKKGEAPIPMVERDTVTTVVEKVKQPATSEESFTVHEVDYSKLKPIYHRTMEGDQLPILADQYGQSVDLLMKWNKFGSEEESLGDKVIIGWYIPTKRPSSVRPVLTVSQQESTFRKKYDAKNSDQITYKRIKEKGKGTWLRDKTASDQNYYCLHKTAPIRSIIRVVNPMNKKTVYVQVVGRPPASGEDEGISIKLTYAAVKKLNLRDKIFLLEWSYHLPKGG